MLDISYPCAIEKENPASPALAYLDDSGSLMYSEALLLDGIFCCLLLRAQFDEALNRARTEK